MEHKISKILCIIQFQLTRFYHIIDKFGVMNNFYFHAILPIIVLQGIIAVRALGNNFFYSLIFKYLNIFPGHSIKNKFITKAAHAVTAAQLVFSQDTP